MTIKQDQNIQDFSTDACDVDERVYPTYKLRIIDAVLREQGIKTIDFLESTGLDESDMASIRARVSQRQVIIAYSNAVKLSKDLAIGLHAGQQVSITDYGVYGYALISNSCLRKALEFSIKYHRLATPTVEMSLHVEDNVAVFGMKDKLNTTEVRDFNLEFQLSLVFSLFKEMVGNNFRYDEVLVGYQAPSHASQYSKVLDCDVRFSQSKNELRFDANLLDIPLVRANPITAEITREACDKILLEMSATSGLAHDVYQILTDNLNLFSNIESVARHLNMTSRTLRRKLALQGTSFNKILTEIRKQVSIVYLRQSDMSINEVTERLGFSDPANFRQAFKRWTGQTPTAYRKKQYCFLK